MKKETVSYSEAVNAINTINPPRRQQGQWDRVQSDLSKAKGKTGMLVYHLKHDIKDACKPFDDRSQALSQRRQEAQAELREIFFGDDEKQKDEKDLSKAEKEKKAKLEEELDSIAEDFKSLSEEEVEITFTKGKLPFDKIMDYISSDEIEALDFAIDGLR